MSVQVDTSRTDVSAASPSDASVSGLAALVRQHDWSNTPIGSIEAWPQSLRTVVNILLTSRYAMWMGWGEQLTFLYNDAYRPTLGIKHPWALGKPASKVWAEIWKDIGPRIQTVLSTGQATFDQGLLLFLERSGFREETYHTFSYSPLSDDDGRVNGMLCVVTEETERVISERQMTTLRDLAASLAASKSEADVLASVEGQLGDNQYDLPFTLLYLFDSLGQAKLACATGLKSEGEFAMPLQIEAGAKQPWPAAEIYAGSGPLVVENLASRTQSGEAPSGAWDKAPEKAVVVPIGQQVHNAPAGFLVAGINPYRRFDAAYSGFVELVAGQIAAGIANARAYQEERRRAEALAELDRAKTTFFSNVSHEFRTPLTLMLGPLEEMLSKPHQLDGQSRDLLQVVHQSGLRLQRLVNTLLDFSRIEAGRAQARYRPTDLAGFTLELASSFRSAMERAGLQFVVDCPPLSEPVYVDHEMWEKVVLNLVSNAFKYTLSGSVFVQLRTRDRGVELAVTDTGAGIPEQQQSHLFERFHRIEGTLGRSHEGSGIGLALVQELVRLHGGAVGVASAVGQGSTFRVWLPFGNAHLPADRIGGERTLSTTPIHADAYVEEALRWLHSTTDAPQSNNAAQAGTEPADNSLSSAARSRVLIADDNADMRDYIRRLLSERHTVVRASNGEEALARALEDPPDLVLTDVMMPGLDGFGLLRKLRANERTRTLPIILLSARAGEESRVEGLDAGADDYLVKPFTARELLARVDAHLSLARMRREADEEIRRKNQELMKVNSELEEFAYVASHDLQEPLRMVNIYTHLLLRRGGLERDPRLAEYADFIHKGVTRMEELISDLLVYSRVVHPEQEEAQVADLDRSLDEAISGLEVRIRETGATIARTPLPKVFADERQLTLVFQNLLSNALKYKQDETAPKVEIWAEDCADECVVNVRDNGIGFAPAHSERIFGLFKRLHKTAYPGTGLGLAICRRVIERYGGRIWAVSQGEGQGAMFSFSLGRSAA